MARLNTRSSPRRVPPGPLATTGPTTTHEGGYGYSMDVKSELFTAAVTTMYGENTFYESGDDRAARFRSLVRSATTADAVWTGEFIHWLRHEANMRTVAIVAAAEYVAGGGDNGRYVIDSALDRPDEPGELIAYWLSQYGRNLPMPVKRGVGDAVNRLYNERSLLKYDTPSHAVRFGDVIELTHPKPATARQSALFAHAIDRRHGRDAKDMYALPVLEDAYRLDAVPMDRRRGLLHDVQASSAFTWERLSGWLPGGMDAAAWEAVIPTMGYMAMLRNLRNFEEARVNRAILDGVAARIADPGEVARSRQFPYRFWSAYRELDAAGSNRFLPALERALEHSVANVPILSGRTLIMVDTSASMKNQSRRSKATLVELAALFGAVVIGTSNAEMWAYATDTYQVHPALSVLGTTRKVLAEVGRVGHGTETWPSTHKAIAASGKFDRVLVFSDMQDHSAWGGETAPDLPTYVWDLGGYGRSNVDTNRSGHYLLGGFSDQAFRIVPLLEAGRDGRWPWQA